MRLRWHYGDQLVWRTRMIVLTLEPGEAERLAEGALYAIHLYNCLVDWRIVWHCPTHSRTIWSN